MTTRRSGPVIAGWEILGHLGAGAMGDVWKARRTSDRVLAALKVVKPPRLLTADQVASLFRREALAGLHADHPNLVRALDAGTTADGSAWLALEFVEGRTLAAVIAEDGALPETRVVEIGAGLARALGEVHRMGLVHRDLKPRNVMIQPGGEVKLLDLGLVVEAADEGRGHAMGSPGFYAPEIAAGEKGGPRSDFFSLGATLAAAATGRMPAAATPGEGGVAPSTAGGTPLSPGLRQVLQRLLRADPAARYGSAAEIVLDLEALAAGDRPLGAILGESGARVVRRGPRVAAVAAVAAAVAAAAWWGATRPAAPPAPAPVPRSVGTADAVPRNAQIEAARVFLEKFPDDLVRGRTLLAQADTPDLTVAERAELEALRGAWTKRFADAADAEHAGRDARLRAAIGAGDVSQAREIAAGWPESLRDSPRGTELARAAEEAASGVRSGNETLAQDADRLVREPRADLDVVAAADALLGRIDQSLARPAFDGDGRGELAASRAALDLFRRSALDARAAGAAVARWREAIAAHAAGPSPVRLREALAAAKAAAMPAQTRSDADAVAGSLARAETWLEARIATIEGKPWCGPSGVALRCGAASVLPGGDDVFLSPLWAATGGRTAAVVAAAKGADEGAAWLLARGLFDEAVAASGPGGAVTRLLEGVPRGTARAASPASWPAGFDAGLALRGPGSPASAAPGADPVVLAWAAAAVPGARPAAPASGGPVKAAGRDAFLGGDLEKAASALGSAALADPRDAEVAALRGRVFLIGARTLPTAPALLAALSEGRRAWDLDPKLPAGPLLTADAGLELLDVAEPALAARVRAVTVAACEVADSLGRADPRMLLFAGEAHLDAGRAQQGATLVRRAAGDAPGSAAAALLLARAEHACGRDDKARDALRRARELLRGTLPESAEELARALGVR